MRLLLDFSGLETCGVRTKLKMWNVVKEIASEKKQVKQQDMKLDFIKKRHDHLLTNPNNSFQYDLI